jgi:hypothetical protein
MIQDMQHQATYIMLATKFEQIGSMGWSFISPILQLLIVLVIIDWLLTKWGITIGSSSFHIDWNVQSIIALVVVCAFAISALGGIISGTSALKDVVLVVIGFYFGIQKKSSANNQGESDESISAKLPKRLK